MPCRVLIVMPGLAGNGPSRSVLDLASELPPLGVAVELFTIRSLELGEIPHDETGATATDRVLELTSGALPYGRRYRYMLLPLSSRLLRSVRHADIVLSGWDVGEALVAAFLSGRAFGKPVLVIVGAHPATGLELFAHGWTKAVSRWLYPRLDGAICHSQGQVPIITSLGVPRERVRAIPNGINVERVRALASESPPGWLPRDGPLVVSAGRLHEEKRFDVLIEAHAEVMASGFPHKLVILGQGPQQEALESLVARLNVSDSVLLPGFVHNPFPTMAQASLFCLSSQYEGWSLVLTEALALGVPVMATDVLSGPSQILDGGRYGELIEPGSVEALAGAIARHLREPDVLQAKARAGRRHAESFSSHARAAGYARLFEELLG